jgi:anti-anti-sigma factor
VADEPRATVALTGPVTPEGLEDLRRHATAALAAGAREIAIDLDGAGILAAPALSTLIRILREARERGASVVLVAGRPSILDTLRVTALDKVFDVRAPEADIVVARPAVPSRRGFAARPIAALAAGLLALGALSAARAGADAPPATPHEILQNVMAQNADMQSYEAKVGVDFRLRSFPYVAQHLDGTTYFKRPNNFEVVFTKVPSYAKGFDRLYSDIDDPSSWERRFDISIVGEKTVAGRRDVLLRLVQKVRGMIDHEDVAVDPAGWRIDEMEWHYYNGGVISMTQDFQTVGPFTVLAKQHATIRIPFVHAGAEATYTDYRTNVAIDDAVFTRAVTH